MNYNIDIDSYIGKWWDSNSYTIRNTKKEVKTALAAIKGKPAFVRMNSLGGDVDHALDISGSFEIHGDVTVDMYAFNASAATVSTLGASKVRAHVDSLYLIHKAMSKVDAYGLMNEDDIQALIDELEKEKKENEKITLVLARKYVLKSGKPLVEILNLMKEETWLTANEAKEWGFVDEVFGNSSGKVNFSADMKARFNSFELPIPTRFVNNQDNKGFFEKMEERFDVFKNDILSRIGKNNDTNNENPVINMNKEWTLVNTLLGVEGIETKDGKANLTEDQLKKLNDALQSANEAKTNAENGLTEKTNAYNQLKTDYDNLKASAGDKTNSVNKKTDVDENPVENSSAEVYDRARLMFNALPDE